MKILGDSLFAKNPNGTLKSRIGTLFLRTPGLVTLKGVHAMQRIAWVRELDRARAEQGLGPLPDGEREAEWAQSVDLLFLNDTILIRPDPSRMDLALQADEVLQTLVSKRRIRFLNTSAAPVRDALRARGENWRMSRPAQSPEEIVRAIAEARVAIKCEPLYYYNPHTGTRYLTVAGFAQMRALSGADRRAQVAEIVAGLAAVNRLGQGEVALFPTTLEPSVAQTLKALDAEKLSDAALDAALEALETKWRMALAPCLREESVANLDWRNEMSATLARTPNATEVGDQDLVQGISPEFYRQIEWMPGGRVENGALIFDALYDEAQGTEDPELLELCDMRVHSILFNLMRLFGAVEYVNVGRIAHSLARRPVAGARRGSVYLVQCKEAGRAAPRHYMIRFQKWGVAERLDQGQDLLQAILGASEYADYILDRRLACRQLGMNLPGHLGFGQFTEKYLSRNQYYGTVIRAFYYVRAYEPGLASDKVPPERFRNPAFALAFARLMGEAAAVDLVVGRAATETGECTFDTNYEVMRLGPDGLPASVIVTDHAGSFVKYTETFDQLIAPYARVVRRRERFVGDFAAFAKTYVAAFARRLAAVQATYRARRHAFDELFRHRPYDEGGSASYRWGRILARLDACDPDAVAESLKKAIQA